jgi:hypothetical protein
MTTQTIIGIRNSRPEAIAVARGMSLKTEFDALVLAGGNGFEYIELLDSRRGRVKRKTFPAQGEKPKATTKKSKE